MGVGVCLKAYEEETNANEGIQLFIPLKNLNQQNGSAMALKFQVFSMT
jgi:hypothetical protein